MYDILKWVIFFKCNIMNEWTIHWISLAVMGYRIIEGGDLALPTLMKIEA